MRSLSLITLCLLAIFPLSLQAQPPKSLLVDLQAGQFVGLPIHWGTIDAALLEPNGQIRVFQQHEVRQHQLLDINFQPMSAVETRTKLQAEMGSGYETQITGPYVIAAPKGEVSRWESRFRSLLAGYQRYFETRGWSLRSPDFPLTVIVLPNQSEFAKMASRESAGSTIGKNLAGMYLTRTNRCLLYHLSSGKSTDWETTEATIVHEAVHQLAYNTGLHERLFEHPIWMVEGLATMFEVAAVYDNNVPNSEVRMRINKEKAGHIKQFIGDDASGLGDFFDNLVSSDHLFRTHPHEAYSLAWAMTFYLAERMPKQYFEYIELQRQRGFQLYSESDRNLDFRRAFNLTPNQLAAPVLKLIN
jgi:Protein of unknown function (DUF1570)